MQNNGVEQSIHSDESVIDRKFQNNTYRNVLKLRTFNFWLNKLFSEDMNKVAFNSNGEEVDVAIKRMGQIFHRSNFRDVVNKYLSKKSMGEGYGAITFKLVDDFMGKPIPMFQVAEGVVKYNTFAETTTEIQVIEKITRGIVPILRVKTYGTITDTITYQLEEQFSLSNYDGDDKEDIKKLLETTEKFVHNYGFVRAIIFRNRVDDKHYDYGQNDLNGYEELINNIDVMNNRALNDIDKNTTHISRTLSSGNVLGGDNYNGGYGVFGEQFSNQDGQVKETYRTINTEEGVDSVVISGDITLTNLKDELRAAITELDQLLGIQVGYNAEGKTNDTSTKSNMIGDPAHREAALRKLVEQEFWTKAMEIAMKLDPEKEHWKGVASIQITPKINDYRNKVLMIENIDKISKYLPLKQMFIEMFDVSPQQAQDMLDNKEKEVLKYITSALPIMNGNLAQNLSVPFKWATEIEQEQPQEDSGEGGEDGREEKE